MDLYRCYMNYLNTLTQNDKCQFVKHIFHLNFIDNLLIGIVPNILQLNLFYHLISIKKYRYLFVKNNNPVKTLINMKYDKNCMIFLRQNYDKIDIKQHFDHMFEFVYHHHGFRESFYDRIANNEILQNNMHHDFMTNFKKYVAEIDEEINYKIIENICEEKYINLNANKKILLINVKNILELKNDEFVENYVYDMFKYKTIYNWLKRDNYIFLKNSKNGVKEVFKITDYGMLEKNGVEYYVALQPEIEFEHIYYYIDLNRKNLTRKMYKNPFNKRLYTRYNLKYICDMNIYVKCELFRILYLCVNRINKYIEKEILTNIVEHYLFEV